MSVHDQYGNLYRVGDHEVRASDSITTDDFPGAIPGPYGIEYVIDGGRPVIGVAADTDLSAAGTRLSTSGRRSIGYTHNGAAALAQIVTLQLRVPGTSRGCGRSPYYYW